MVKNAFHAVIIGLLAVVAALAVGTGAAQASCVEIKECSVLPRPGDPPGTTCYRLADNVSATGTCFPVTQTKMIIDLHGWRITGDGTGSGIGEAGVCAAPGACRTTVLSCETITPPSGSPFVVCTSPTSPKGEITKFEDGINLPNGVLNEIRNINVFDNSGDGINAGDRALVKDCIATDNKGEGIVGGDFSQVNNCVASNNGSGIDCGDKCIVVKNTTNGNTVGNGITAGTSSEVKNNTSAGNAGNGIEGGDRVVVNFNMSTGNGAEGIVAGDFCVVMGNNASCNNSGIKTGEKCIVKNNIANDNETIGINVAEGNPSGGSVIQFNTAKDTPACFVQEIDIKVFCPPGASPTIVSYNHATNIVIVPPVGNSCIVANNVDP